MKKVVRIGTMPVYGGRQASVYCKIEYSAGRLSISGVIGPAHNGNALGSCGQILDTLAKETDTITLAPAWSPVMLQRFLSIWDEWHLNDMRAYNDEMKAAGWAVTARAEMLGYKYTLKPEIAEQQRKLKERAEVALRERGMASYTPEEQVVMNLPYSLVLWDYACVVDGPKPPEQYERSKNLHAHGGGIEPPERKTLGWLYPKDHPDGLLGRKMRDEYGREFGPGYGTAHFMHPVPQDVIDFLTSLPDTDKQPAWV